MPGIVPWCDIGLFHAFNRQRGIKTPQNPTHLKRGQRLKHTTRAKAKGQSSDGSTRGILKGGAIRAGASCSPLEPASLLTFLPEQESKAPLASACRKPIGEQMKRLKMGIDNRKQVPPPKAKRNCTARWLPQSRRRPPGAPRPCQLPPGGSYGACTLPHWLVALGECLL